MTCAGTLAAWVAEREEELRRAALKASIEKLFQGASEGNVQQVQSALSEVNNPNIRDDNGSTALHVAVSNGQADIVTLLLERGANMNSVIEEACDHVCSVA